MLLDQTIGQIEFSQISQTFPVIWWESNKCQGYVKSKEDLVRIQDKFTDNQCNILNARCTFKGIEEGIPNFGMRGEHNGDTTLREFLKIKNIDLSNLNLFA